MYLRMCVCAYLRFEKTAILDSGVVIGDRPDLVDPHLIETSSSPESVTVWRKRFSVRIRSHRSLIFED